MDFSQLKSLGEIAGIGGIALGVVVLLVRPLIGTIAGLPKDARASSVKLIALGCFVIGALGIAAWTFGGQAKGPQVSTGATLSPGAISNSADTKGNYSPAVNAGSGNVSIQYQGAPAAPSPAAK